MKKVSVLLLIAAMTISMAACGTKKEEAKPSAASEASAEVSEASEEASEGASEASEAASEEASEASEETAAKKADIITVKPEEATSVLGEDLKMVMENNTDEYDGVKYNGELWIEYGKEKLMVTDFAEWINDSYAVPIDEKSFYLVVQEGASNDWTVTDLLKYDEDGFTKIDSVLGSAEDISDILTGKITIGTRVDALGTYGVKIPMEFVDGQFERIDQCIVFTPIEPDSHFWDNYSDLDEDTETFLKAIFAEDGTRILTLKQTMDAKTVSGEAIVVAAGDTIVPEKYDPDNGLFYFTYKGKECFISYETNEESYERTVNGINENEMFVALPYAG